jgi:hypothetical protein
MEPSIPPVQQTQANDKQPEDLGLFLKIISFFFPFIGAVLYIAQKRTRPVAAKQACTFAWFGVAAGFIFNILYFILKSLTR